MKLSKKQSQLISDIRKQNLNEIYVLGSTQSGKTHSIALATLLYAQDLYNYNPTAEFDGAIIGWSTSTMRKNILDVMLGFLKEWGLEEGKDYTLRWTQSDKEFKIFNITFTFFAFNNALSYNKIVGRPLIFVWVDESARIYTQKALQEGFEQLDTRQMSYIIHPYYKKIHSFNVEGNENHDYKVNILDKKTNARHYTFYPYDNPLLNTEEAIRKVVNLYTGSLKEQKVFCKWVIAEGKVFNKIPRIRELGNWVIRDVVIGIDYGSVHPTVFTPLALCWNMETNQWKVIRLGIYFHDPIREGTNPTTEFFSKQLIMFIQYIGGKYNNVKLTNTVLDSAAAHFHNRLITDGIQHELTNKASMTVNEGVELMQSLFEKEYLVMLEKPSIRYFRPNGTPVYSGKDDGIIEMEGYQYDKIKSLATGQNIFKKDKDDATDSCRYGVVVLRDTGRIPNV